MDKQKYGIDLESDFQAPPIAKTSQISQPNDNKPPQHHQQFPAETKTGDSEEEKIEFLSISDLPNPQEFLEEHPLIALETKERVGFDRFEGDTVSYKEISPLQQKNLSLKVATEGIDRIDLNIFPKYTFTHDISGQYFHSYENFGQPLCITVLPGRYVALGTSNGLIFVYDYEFRPVSRFGKIKKKEYGAITAIDISPSEEFIVCGYSSGNVILWSREQTEFIKDLKVTRKEPILNIKFLMNSESFVATVPDGSIYLCKIQSGIFSWGIEKIPVDIKSSGEPAVAGNEQEHNRQSSTTIFPDGFFAISTMPKEIITDYQDDEMEIVALASMNEIVVITLESFSHFVYRFKRPAIPDSIVPCINWGKGMVPGQGNVLETLLAISWGRDLFLLKIENREGFETYNEYGEKLERMIIVGCYYSPDVITSLEWISHSKIVTYNTGGKYKILYTGHFKIWADTRENFDYSIADITSITLKADETQFQICIDKEKEARHQKSVLYFTQTVRGVYGKDQLLAVGSTNIFALKHMDWMDTITKLFEKADWLSALSLCASIYNDPAATFAGLPPDPLQRRQVVGGYAIDLANKYIKAIHRLGNFAPTNIKQDETWQPVIFTVIDFLLSTGNAECLFSEIKSVMQALGLYKLFFQSLKPFIQARMMQATPIDALKEIVKFYLNEGRADLARYLIINVSSANIDYAITLCLQNNLLTPLLYICSNRKDQGGPDFLTPLGRALGMYKKSVEEKDPNLDYGMKFLWFLHMILNGRMFPVGVLSDETWEAKVKEILILVFEEANLDLLLSVEAFVAFEVLETLFKPTMTYLIKSWDDDMIQFMDITNLHLQSSTGNKNNSKFLRLSQQFHSHFECSTSSMIQDRMLGLIYYCSKKNEKYENHLFYFLGSLQVNYNCNLPLDIVEETFFYIVKWPYVVPKWRIPIQEGNKAPETLFNEERNLYLLELFKRLEATVDDRFLEEVSLQTEQTNFLDLKSYIFSMKKDYERGFKLYLSQKEKSKQMKIFEWLRTLILKMKDNSSDELPVLKELIISKLGSLIPIDGQETRQIISILGSTSSNLDMEVLKHLESSPQLQLDYVQEIMSRGGRATDEMLALHIKLLCQLSPSSVVEELKARDYPLDKCVKLCKEYHIKDALAFLLEKVGYYKGALEVRLEIFEKALKKESSTSLDELNQKFKEVLNTCVFCDHTESSTLQELWFFALDKLIDLYKKYIVSSQNSSQPDLNKVYVAYLSELIEGMSKVVPVETIVEKIESYKELQLEDLKASLLGVYALQSYEKQVLYNMRSVIMESNTSDMTLLHDLSVKSFLDILFDKDQGNGIKVSKPRVTKAEESGDKTILTFSCGHAINKDKAEGNYCSLCVEKDEFHASAVVDTTHKNITGINQVESSEKQEINLEEDKENFEKAENVVFDHTFLDAAEEEKFKSFIKANPAFDKQTYLERIKEFEKWKSLNSNEWEDKTNQSNIDPVNFSKE